MPAAGDRAVSEPVTVLAWGEVRTALLPGSRTLTGEESARLLRLRSGDRVRRSTRPRPYTVSPDVLTGVDCALPTATGVRIRAVGTVSAHAVLTEGRVLQSSARCAAPAAGDHERRPWGRHLMEPGVVRPFGRLPADDVAAGWLDGPARPGDLALGAVAERLLTQVARHPLLDHRPPFKSRPVKLRWAVLRAEATAPGPSVERFALDADGLRTLRLRVPQETRWEAAEAFCEDLALHDWLLTTLVAMIERSRLGSTDGPGAVRALRPAVDHLLHLWMPMTRVEPSLEALWRTLEREAGFTRQWNALVQRIRDQLALLNVERGWAVR